MKEEIAKVQKKTVKVIKVDIDSDDENGGPGEGLDGRHDGTTGERTKAAEGVGGAAEGVGEPTETVRAEKVVSGAGKSGEKEKEIFETRARYPLRDRKTPGKFWVFDTGWVTPKAKKRAGKSG
jgi:hypothetical protein